LCSLVSPGTELAGDYLGTDFPKFPGYAAVMRATEVGDEVENISIGDILFCPGPHQSIQQLAASRVVRLPEGLTPETAVLARLMGVSLTTLMTTTARPGDLVLVVGAGPVGFLAAQNFLLAGYDVRVVEIDEIRRNLAAASGVTAVYAEMPMDDPSVKGRVALVLECSGHETTVGQACQIVRRRGEVVLVGVPWKRRADLQAFEVISAVFLNYAVLRSGWEWELPWDTDAKYQPWSVMDGFARCLGWLAEGRVKCEGLVNCWVPNQCGELYESLRASKCAGLFQVFDWRLQNQ